MCHALIEDPRFATFLLRIDHELAAQARAEWLSLRGRIASRQLPAHATRLCLRSSLPFFVSTEFQLLSVSPAFDLDVRSVRFREGAPRANMTCYTYSREISEQRGRYDNQPSTQGSDARREQFDLAPEKRIPC